MHKLPVGRLAFRVEGDWWNAYWAPRQDSMRDAVHLGSIRMSLGGDPAVKASFMDTMRLAFTRVVKESLGVAPIWGGTEKAPEAERSGRS
jgi:hypothetical protein